MTRNFPASLPLDTRWRACLVVFLAAACALLIFARGAFASKSSGRSVVIEIEYLKVVLDSGAGSLRLTDKQSGNVWASAIGPNSYPIVNLERSGSAVTGFITVQGEKFQLLFSVDNRELTVRIKGPYKDGAAASGGPDILAYPPPLVSRKSGSSLVIPYAEGILLPVNKIELAERFDLTSIPFKVYAMLGLSMPWFGETDLKGGYMAIFETPFEGAALRLKIGDGRYLPQPLWERSMGKWGGERRLRYVFFPEGGYVRMAKYYRR